MFRFKVDLQVAGRDWGVSVGAGRVVRMDEVIGDGKTLRFLIDHGCVLPDHFEDIAPAVPAWVPPPDEPPAGEDEE